MNKLNWTKTACALFVVCAATAIALPAQTFTVLHSLDYTEGLEPYAGLVQATDGNLYGTVPYGGRGTCFGYGCGTVFKMSPSGALTTLYSFGGTDGSIPYAGLIQATDGNFYGTTYAGGANTTECGGYGCGTVFRITPSGTLTTVYSFCSQSNCTDGDEPYAGLVQAIDGNFYGTTYGGGANGDGMVFKITPGGTLTTLHSFDITDGSYPVAGLVQGTDGNFYGTTEYGGTNTTECPGYGCGTVFKITPSGTLATIYSFCSLANCTDGSIPYAGLIQASNGNFYGTAEYGGPSTSCVGGCGTLFKVTPAGTLTTLHSFDGADGGEPEAALVQATDGNFYGTTSSFGANGYGTVFKITPSGTVTTLYSFCSQSGCADGELPYAGLVQDTNGTFYGTTAFGGANDDGTVFSLSVGFAPFVETHPNFGPVGSPVKILGTNLTGATSVTFNGTPAVFTVFSSSLIGAKVPAGATTGTVQVVTPGGTLSSNVPFRVRH